MSQQTVRKKPRKNRKFRFQLLKEWIIGHYQPCRVADVGGGKGLLAFLLERDGWDVTVIDPERTIPLKKFKDMELGRRVKLTVEDWDKLKWREEKFCKEMVEDFDLLISLHGHGVNMKIIEAAAEYHKKFIILPCCVIDEPIVKRPGVDWLASLVEYAENKELRVGQADLNFKGKNRIIYNF